MGEKILFIVSLAGRHLCYKTSVSGVSREELMMGLRSAVITVKQCSLSWESDEIKGLCEYYLLCFNKGYQVLLS